jgi:hypothetical protein
LRASSLRLLVKRRQLDAIEALCDKRRDTSRKSVGCINKLAIKGYKGVDDCNAWNEETVENQEPSWLSEFFPTAPEPSFYSDRCAKDKKQNCHYENDWTHSPELTRTVDRDAQSNAYRKTCGMTRQFTIDKLGLSLYRIALIAPLKVALNPAVCESPIWFIL